MVVVTLTNHGCWVARSGLTSSQFSAGGVPLIASTEEKTSGGARVDAPTYYEYGQGNYTSGRSDWLEVVKRGNPSNGNDKLQLARFVYGVPVTGDGASLPNLSAEQVRLWGQGSEARPVTGFAVFGPGKDITTSKAAGGGPGIGSTRTCNSWIQMTGS